MLEEEKKGRSRKKEEEEPFDLKKEIISWIQIIAAAVIIALVLNNFIIANSRSYGKYHYDQKPCDRLQAFLLNR